MTYFTVRKVAGKDEYKISRGAVLGPAFEKEAGQGFEWSQVVKSDVGKFDSPNDDALIVEANRLRAEATEDRMEQERLRQGFISGEKIRNMGPSSD